jgi:hypothetical protein
MRGNENLQKTIIKNFSTHVILSTDPRSANEVHEGREGKRKILNHPIIFNEVKNPCALKT